MARLPSTFQVLTHVLEELKKLTNFSLLSYLDIGCGPGASYWAAKELYPSLSQISLLENNPFMYKVLSSITEHLPHTSLIKEDCKKFKPDNSYELISFSYSLGEMDQQEDILRKYWDLTKKALILIEPGTPQGFQTILKARHVLLNLGAFCIAPCGHNSPCPLENEIRDWCHFSLRVTRSNAHKAIKKGTLGYEDEKFSYLIVTKEPSSSVGFRILKKPLKSKGHIRFDLCTPNGIEKRILSKSNKINYKLLKDKNWGDVF